MFIALHHPVDIRIHRITQHFGENPTIYSQFSYAGIPLQGHNGIDFAARDSVCHPVYAAADGLATKIAFESGGFGQHLVIQSPGFRTLYAHLSHCALQTGTPVKAMQLIGHTGSTGFSTGIHLHFGLYPDSEPKLNGFGGAVNPYPYLGVGDEFHPTGSVKVIQSTSSTIPYKIFFLKPKKLGHRK